MNLACLASMRKKLSLRGVFRWLHNKKSWLYSPLGYLDALIRREPFAKSHENGLSFEEEYIASGDGLVRFGFFLGGILYLVFLPWDWIVDPATFPITSIIRCFVISPTLILFAVFWHRIPGPSAARSAIALLVGDIGLTSIYYIQASGFEFSITGNMMILVFIFVFVRLPFRHIVLFSVVAVLIYFVFGLLKVGAGDPVLFLHMMVIVSTSLMGLFAVYGIQVNAERIYDLRRELSESKERLEMMLYDILPQRLVARLMAGERSVAEPIDKTIFMFVDIVGSTRLTNQLVPERLVELLNAYFASFDTVIQAYDWEKIKTTGDGYIAIKRSLDGLDAASIVSTLLDLFSSTAKTAAAYSVPLRIRIGLSYGSAIGGVIGMSKYMYDCWGSAVNMASRLEASATAGSVNMSEEVYSYLADYLPECVISDVTLKGFGAVRVRTWSPFIAES